MSYNKIESQQTINLAFLGCGKITKSHSKTIKKYKDVHRFYASRTEKKALEYSQKLGGKGYFGSYESAINSPDINTVFICTPPDSHLDLALKAIRAGKHVIVEKPPFFKASDFDLIEKERTKTGVQVMVAENYFYKPLLIKLRQILQKDLIGQPKFMYFNATKTQKNEDWRNEKSLVGGGALFEGGIHWVNFISNMGLKVSSVSGFQPDTSKEKLERSMQVVFEFEEGAVATLLYSWEINTLFFGLRLSKIFGTKGSITLESNGLFLFVRGKKWRFILPGFSDIVGKKAMFRDFFKALRSGEEPEFNLALAKRDLTFIEKAYGRN
jgi:predicted dehydrogenase